MSGEYPRMNGKVIIHLKDGSSFEGNITFDGKDEIYIVVDNKSYIVMKHEVKYVETIKNNNPLKFRPIK